MQNIQGKIRKTLDNYSMIQPGDKIAVGLSGGKDSTILLSALANLRRYYPIPFEVVAISIDMFNGKTDYSPLTQYVNSLGIEHHIIPTPLYELLFEIRKEPNPCSLCARMRRGLLNSTAVELGCTKVALGHHADDLIETFFLSMFYESRLSTFAPVTYLSRSNITVIRPMLLVREKDIIRASRDLPIIHNPCPADKHTQREYVKDLLKNISHDVPKLHEKVLSAIIHPDRYHLFNDFTKDSD